MNSHIGPNKKPEFHKLDEFSLEAVENLSPENIRKKVKKDLEALRSINSPPKLLRKIFKLI